MKLVRYGAIGREKPGLVDAAGALRDLSSIIPDIDAQTLGRQGRARLAAIDPGTLPLMTGAPRYGSPVAHVSKLICVGMNYREHAAETHTPVPEQPVIFMKATSAIMGPNDDVIIPENSVKTDWEVELGVVIGGFVRNVPERDARDVIAGFVVADDLTDRGWQFERGGQWSKGKSADSFAPVGPWLVTSDQFPDTPDLAQKEHRHETR